MEILHAGNKSSKYSRCGGAASYLQWWPYCLSVWVAAHCGRAFRMAFTSSATAVSANSNWSCSERRRRGRVRQGGLKHNSQIVDRSKFCAEKQQTDTLGSDGTLVQTKPGLWSRMCSRVAAMSISFTPGKKWTRWETLEPLSGKFEKKKGELPDCILHVSFMYVIFFLLPILNKYIWKKKQKKIEGWVEFSVISTIILTVAL